MYSALRRHFSVGSAHSRLALLLLPSDTRYLFGAASKASYHSTVQYSTVRTLSISHGRAYAGVFVIDSGRLVGQTIWGSVLSFLYRRRQVLCRFGMLTRGSRTSKEERVSKYDN